jgi:hypothetical protein
MPGLDTIGMIIFGGAAAVLVIYRLQVFLGLMKDSPLRRGTRLSEADQARSLNVALDRAAEERRMSTDAHRRMGPPAFETIQAVEGPNSTTIVLVHNHGGLAFGATVSAQQATAYVNPSDIEPDDNVQFTFLDVDPSRVVIDFTMDYVNAAGVPKEHDLEYDIDAREIRPR